MAEATVCDTGTPISVQIQVPGALFLTQHPTDVPGKASKMAQGLGSLPAMWDNRIRLLPPGFTLVEPQPWQSLGGVYQKKEDQSINLFLSTSLFLHVTLAFKYIKVFL